MPQHIWRGSNKYRVCEECLAPQVRQQNTWMPEISPICPGDPDHDDRRNPRRRPNAPSGDGAPTRVPEMA